MRRGIVTAALTAVAMTGTAGEAVATTQIEAVVRDGVFVLVLTGDDAAQDLRLTTLTAAEGQVRISDDEAFVLHGDATTACAPDGETAVACVMPDVFTASLGGGADLLTVKDRSGVAPVGVDGGPGHDTINGSPGSDVVLGGPGNDHLSGGAGGDDEVDGGEGDDLLGGWSGHPEGFTDDEVHSGTDRYVGGAGEDAFDWGMRTEGVRTTLDDVADDGVPGEGDLVAADIEDLEGTPYDDVLIGSDAPNDIVGGFGGDDVLDGRGGDDRLRGWSGQDQLTGGPGIDELLGEAGNDQLHLRDGGPDNGDCGSGNDFAQVDDEQTDRTVEGACERIDGPLFPPDSQPDSQPATTTATPTTTSTTTTGTATTPQTVDPVPVTPTVLAVSATVPARVRLGTLLRGLRFRVRAPAAGTGTARLLRGRTVVARARFRAVRAQNVRVRLQLTKRARRRASRLRGRTLTLHVAFKPAGGTSVRHRSKVRVR